MQSLRELGLNENTLVVFTSDHGDNLGSHGRMGKGQLNQKFSRIHLCVRGPGVAAGHVSQGVASLVDLAPTALSMLGLSIPNHLHGRDLAPALRGQPPIPDHNHTLIESINQGIAIRSPSLLLGMAHGNTPRDHLAAPDRFFKLDADPFEQSPLDPQSPDAAPLLGTLQQGDRSTPWLDTSAFLRST